MTTDNEQTTLSPCPWCAAVPVKTDLAPSQRYRLDHKPTCYLYGQMTGMRGNSHYIFIALNKAEQWNTRLSAASTAPVGSKWSKEPPKVDGVYWWRADEKDNEPDIHSVVAGYFYEVGTVKRERVENFGGEWLGPISPAAASPAAPQEDAEIMNRVYTDASVVVDSLSMDLSALRSENRLMRSVVDAAIAYTVEFKTGMTSEALQRLAIAVNTYVDGRASCAAPTPSQPARDAETLVKQWIATLQDESHVTDEDAEDLVLRIIAFKSAPAAAAETVGERDAVAGAYENAAVIAENCTQDDAARDEPFRIAQTIREHARLLKGES